MSRKTSMPKPPAMKRVKGQKTMSTKTPSLKSPSTGARKPFR